MSYKYFSSLELSCPCNCSGQMDKDFMDSIIIPMRKDLGFPFSIPKGGAYRCVNYDGKYGAHQGHALDILCNSRQRFKIIEWLIERNIYIKDGLLNGKPVTRFGINNGSIHIDDLQQGSGKADDVVWDYYG